MLNMENENFKNVYQPHKLIMYQTVLVHRKLKQRLNGSIECESIEQLFFKRIIMIMLNMENFTD
jgi:hypothetical protein